MNTLTRNQLTELLNKRESFELINVLSADAFQKAHIPGSTNIPLADDDFVQQVEQQAGDKDKKIVVYCASFACDASPKAAAKLEQAGFTQVFDYEGGLKDWQEGGGSIEGTG